MSHSKLLLLDEPRMDLAPLIVQKIFAAIAEIACSRVTIYWSRRQVRAGKPS